MKLQVLEYLGKALGYDLKQFWNVQDCESSGDKRITAASRFWGTSTAAGAQVGSNTNSSVAVTQLSSTKQRCRHSTNACHATAESK